MYIYDGGVVVGDCDKNVYRNDERGLCRTLLYPSGGTIESTYNSEGRLTKKTFSSDHIPTLVRNCKKTNTVKVIHYKNDWEKFTYSEKYPAFGNLIRYESSDPDTENEDYGYVNKDGILTVYCNGILIYSLAINKKEVTP